MKLEQAARQALEALEQHVERFDYEQFTSICELDPAKEAITVLREALAERHKENCACEVCRGCDNADIKAEQAEQEPVAWMDAAGAIHKHKLQRDWTPLYAAPVRTKDLTDAEIHGIKGYNETREMYDFAHAVIRAYKEKQK